VSLNLFYNSKLWTRISDQEIVFDHDIGFPAPGWSLGFGKAVSMGSNGVALEDADGTLHPFSGVAKTFGNITVLNFHSIDGSLIDCQFEKRNIDDSIQDGWAYYPNGTEVQFGATSGDAVYPIVIADANGNFLTISYRNNIGPQIDFVKDTLGRIINFHYAGDLLTAITAPGVQDGTRTLVRLNYKTLSISTSYPPPLGLRTIHSTSWGIDAIYYPGSATGFWFGDLDSYSSYGMIAKVSQRTGMTLTPASVSLTDQGTISPGNMLRERIYNYPMRPVSTLTEAPTYTKMTETWLRTEVSPAITAYSAQLRANPREFDVTFPDGTQVKELMYNHPGQFDDSLVYSQSTYDASGILVQQVATAWEIGDDGSPRTTSVQVTDRLGQTVKTTYEYTGTHNQIFKVRQFDYDGTTVLRTVQTDYVSDLGYNISHVFNLPKVVQVFGSDSQGAHQARYTEYQYDHQTLMDTPGVVQHGQQFDPHSPLYQPSTDFRGNLTQVTRYTDTGPPSGRIIETRRYDIAGNMVGATTSCCDLTSVRYELNTQFAYPSAVTKGAAPVTPAAQISNSYTYDFNTGLLLTKSDPNRLTTTMFYDGASLRLLRLLLSTGASVTYGYDDVNESITETVSDAAGIVSGQRVTEINGLGLVSSQIALTDSIISDFPARSVVGKQYDQMGRISKFSQPYFVAGPFRETPVWNEVYHDALGRVTQFKAADGSLTNAFYDDGTRPSSSDGAPGHTVLKHDAWGRERWSRSDALGQLTEVVEPNPGGTGKVVDQGNIATHYTYNALGQIVQMVQGPDRQQRDFRYDSLGRLIAQSLPEKSATLGFDGRYLGRTGSWSDVFTYDSRSNLTSHTDARGIRTIFDYGRPLDPLNRLQGISYDMKGFGDAANVVTPVQPSYYKYMPTGDVTRLFRVEMPQASGTSSLGVAEEYGYDGEGRLSSKTVTFSGASPSLSVVYEYDSLGRRKSLTYPAEVGVGAAASSKVDYSYGPGGHLLDMKIDGVELASQFAYNAADQLTMLATGAAGAQQILETYTYDPRNGLLSAQNVYQGGVELLDQKYEFQKPGTSGITGQVTGITLGAAPYRGYKYDALGRLTDASGFLDSHSWTESYTYDSYGNRIGVTKSGQSGKGSHIPLDGSAILAYDPKTNHVTTSGFAYDAAGNQTVVKRARSSLTYRYDAANRLSTVLDGDKEIDVFAYAADRRRISRMSPAQANAWTYYVWDGDNVLSEYSTNALSWSKSSVYLGNRVLATRTPGPSGTLVYYHHRDRLGTRLITNNQDSTIIPRVTLPFGTVIADEGDATVNPIFTTYDRDAATGLDYAVNRTYDHEGRFTEVDPAEMTATSPMNPQSLNLYSYVGNDPVNYIDTTGLKSCQGSGLDPCYHPRISTGIETFDMLTSSWSSGDPRAAQAIQDLQNWYANGGDFPAGAFEYLSSIMSPEQLDQAMYGVMASNAESWQQNTDAGMLAAIGDDALKKVGLGLGAVSGYLAAARAAQQTVTIAEISGLVAGDMPAAIVLTESGAWAAPAGGVVAAFGAGYAVGTLANQLFIGDLIDKAAPGSGALGDWYYRNFLH